MERARWNTELSHKKLNFVICPTFWGHIIEVRPVVFTVFLFWLRPAKLCSLSY